jgi:hypothetical protein
MMLSAAAPLVTPAWPTLSLVGEHGQQIMTLAPGSIMATTPLEGGFISNAQLFGTADTTAIATNAYSSSSPTIADLLSQGPSTLDSVTTRSWTDASSSANSGFVPRVIDSAGTDAEQSPTTLPDSNRNVGARNSQEGGPISIKSLLASINANLETRDDDPALTSSISKPLTPPISSQRSEPTSVKLAVREVSGEWARAAVFEIAGGEPMAARRQADNAHVKPATAATQNAPVPQAAPTASFNATSASTNRDAEEAAQTTPTKTTTGLPLPSSTLGDDVTVQSPVNLHEERALLIGPMPKSASARSDEAVMAAFDQIGDSELALPSPSADRLPLNGWLSGTPLLLMFALECMTARNSRRRRAAEATLEPARPRVL